MTRPLPTLAAAKRQARLLRRGPAGADGAMPHAKALERVAHSYGYRDWNAMRAALGDRPPEGWEPGGSVEGRYLAQPFTAKVLAAEMLRPGWFRLVLDLDEAVDVIRFASFSNFRRRIRTVLGPAGHSRERTSDGTPHVQLKM